MVECEGKKLGNKGVAVFIDNWNSACPQFIRALKAKTHATSPWVGLAFANPSS